MLMQLLEEYNILRIYAYIHCCCEKASDFPRKLNDGQLVVMIDFLLGAYV